MAGAGPSSLLFLGAALCGAPVCAEVGSVVGLGQTQAGGGVRVRFPAGDGAVADGAVGGPQVDEAGFVERVEDHPERQDDGVVGDDEQVFSGGGGEGVAQQGAHAQLDVGDAEAVNRALEQHRPSVIINAAAYTAVDRAETELEAARRVNGQGPRHLARAAGDGTVLASVVMTAWKLVSFLLLAAGISGMAMVVLTGFARRLSGPVPLFLDGQGPHQTTFYHLTFNPVSGVWTQVAGWSGQHPAYISGGTVTWLDQPFPGWHAGRGGLHRQHSAHS